MTTVIEIGAVPSKEALATNQISQTVQAGVFMRQLRRQAPLPLGAKYVAMQRPGKQPWLSVVMTVPVSSWATADESMRLAEVALEVEYWDEVAILELQERGLMPEAVAAQAA